LGLISLKKTPPPVGSVVEVNVTFTTDMGAEANQIGIHICTITEYEDAGAMMSRSGLRIMNGGKCGSAENATTSGGKKVPVSTVVCCVLLG
jgi:hypothetical protein